MKLPNFVKNCNTRNFCIVDAVRLLSTVRIDSKVVDSGVSIFETFYIIWSMDIVRNKRDSKLDHECSSDCYVSGWLDCAMIYMKNLP